MHNIPMHIRSPRATSKALGSRLRGVLQPTQDMLVATYKGLAPKALQISRRLLSTCLDTCVRSFKADGVVLPYSRLPCRYTTGISYKQDADNKNILPVLTRAAQNAFPAAAESVVHMERLA